MFMLDFFVFFFKQKTAYEMRISDWSSDVCSSDLRDGPGPRTQTRDGADRKREQVIGNVVFPPEDPPCDLRAAAVPLTATGHVRPVAPPEVFQTPGTLPRSSHPADPVTTSTLPAKNRKTEVNREVVLEGLEQV